MQIKEVKTGRSLGCSDHAVVEFVILRSMGLAKIKVRMLKFRRDDFQLFKELVDEICWKAPLTDKEMEQIYQILKDAFLGAQEFSISYM